MYDCTHVCVLSEQLLGHEIIQADLNAVRLAHVEQFSAFMGQAAAAVSLLVDVICRASMASADIASHLSYLNCMRLEQQY